MDVDSPVPSASPVPTQPQRRTSRRSSRRGPSLLVELPLLVIVSLTLTLLVRTFLVQPFFIPSGSMEDTLQVDDRVLVNKLAYRLGEIQRGDIVVFDGTDSFSLPGASVEAEEPSSALERVLRPVASAVGLVPSAGKDYIKRVIGVAGDRIVCCDEAGRITVDGVALDDDYVFPGDVPSLSEFDVVVPPGSLWVMGDHRSSSQDSRSLLGAPGGGMVPTDRVAGRAFAVVWPVDRLGWLSTPAAFEQPALAENGVGAAR
jgi:signal peptidase I